ncbi:MAG: FkbM family methyltransferase [Bacteroidia bacterium]|nr:FkbM family methyltransferase [Bacteroidia bacterium]
MIKKLILQLINTLGFDIVKLERNGSLPAIAYKHSMEGAIFRCAQRGIDIKTVIDIGASNGSWSAICMKHYPQAGYLLIEAQDGHKANLDRFISLHPNAQYALAAAGAKKGNIYFQADGLLGGQASETPYEKNNITVPVTTVDDELKERKLAGPYLLKLDTHGYELPIFDGAKNCLAQANIVVVEVYNFQLTDTSLRFHEMIVYMDKLGFRPIEAVDLMLRKKDNAFWQMDLFFVKKDRPEFSSNDYE